MAAKDKPEKQDAAQYRNLRDGKTYTLRIVEKAETQHGRTHQAKSPDSFWDGTEAEFRAQFDKL